MLFIMLLLNIFGLFTSLACAATAVNDLPYPLEVAQFSGSYGGNEYQLNGTAQEIRAQLQSLYPDVKTEIAVPVDNLNLNSRASAGGKDGLLCCPVAGWGWSGAYTDDIESGISYLDGRDTIQIGPRSCGRISCSYDSAIYFCNDGSDPAGIHPNANYLATYAQDIINRCATQVNEGESGFSSTTCGQEFDSDNYNIIVRGDSC